MQLSIKQKYDIILRWENGNTTVQIASDMNISRKTVSKWINKYKLDEKTFLKKGSGRPSKNDNGKK